MAGINEYRIKPELWRLEVRGYESGGASAFVYHDKMRALDHAETFAGSKLTTAIVHYVPESAESATQVGICPSCGYGPVIALPPPESAESAAGGWIHLTARSLDKLPSPGVPVLIALKRRLVGEGFHTGNAWFMADGDRAPEVVAWQPLPAPPASPGEGTGP